MTEKELNRVRDLHGRIRDTEKFLATLRKRAEDLTPKLDGMPHAQTIQSKVELLALDIVEKCNELNSLHEQIIDVTAHLTEQLCHDVPEPNQRTVMILRYVSCLRFRDIALAMELSERKVFELHHTAIETVLD